MNAAEDQTEFRTTPPTHPTPTPPSAPHLSSFSLSLSETFNKICKLYIKRLLSAALNSSLNGFSPGEEIFSKNLEEERGIIVLILLPAVILRHFWRVKWRLVSPIRT